MLLFLDYEVTFVSKCVSFSEDLRVMCIFQKKQSTHIGGVARFGQWSRLFQLIVIKFVITKAEWKN